MKRTTISGLLHELSGLYGDSECIVSRSRGIRLTYRQLDELVDSAAVRMLEEGVRPGMKAGIFAINSPQWLITMFALQRIGAIPVTVNPNLKAIELEYIIGKSDMERLYVDDLFRYSENFADRLDIVTMEMPQEHISDVQTGNLRRAESMTDCMDVAAIQFTSGTTGFPKGVMLTHYGIVNNAVTIGRNLNVKPADRFANCLPLFHGSSCFTASLMTLSGGATLVLLDRYNPKTVLGTIQDEHCTITAGVPTMFINELAQPDFDNYDLSSLECAIMFGSVCPPESMRQVAHRMGCNVLSIYGSTELSPCTCMSLPSDPEHVRWGSIGRPLEGTEQVIVNTETGQPCAQGETGELLCRGYNVMKGYYKDFKATRAAVDSKGFYHTGDAVYMDEEGNCHVIGRVNDMIIHGGDNIYPSEVENVLLKMPGVRAVEVIGLPSPLYGEQVCAVIVPDGNITEHDITAWCRERMATYKIPKYILFTDTFPLTASGKVIKQRLKDIALDKLELRGITVR